MFCAGNALPDYAAPPAPAPSAALGVGRRRRVDPRAVADSVARHDPHDVARGRVNAGGDGRAGSDVVGGETLPVDVVGVGAGHPIAVRPLRSIPRDRETAPVVRHAHGRHSTDAPVALARWPTLAVSLGAVRSVHIFTVFVPLENFTSCPLLAAVRSAEHSG